MESMTRQQRRGMAHKFAMELLQDWRDNNPGALDALDVSHKLVSVIELELFGPTTWIEYDHSRDRATLFTTRWSQEAGTNEEISTPLTEEESAELAEWFGLREAGIAALDNAENLIG